MSVVILEFLIMFELMKFVFLNFSSVTMLVEPFHMVHI